MNKSRKKRLALSKETIRRLVPSELHQIAAGNEFSCGGVSACDCSYEYTDTSVTSDYCTGPQR